MRKHSKFFSISEFCKSNGLQPIEFYEILSRHPELAKKLKSNAKGERLLDEKAITGVKAILRKIEKAKHSQSPMSAAADEINILAAKKEELRKEVIRLRAENDKLKNALRSRRSK
ncbi:MAG: hypothetical protein ACI4SF_02725 [Oscillospiraceae bacterium]